MESTKNTLTVNEASEYCGIGRNTLRDLIAWNKLPIIRIGNKFLIRTDSLNEFLSQNEGHNLRNKNEVVAI